jgi:hypothetical protein
MGTPEGHQKSIFNSPKMKKNKDTYGIYPIKFASSTQKNKKVIGTPNQPFEIKKISNKSIVLQKCKGAKNSYGSYPMEFAGSTQNPKKIIGTPNIPITTKIFLKKLCFVP